MSRENASLSNQICTHCHHSIKLDALVLFCPYCGQLLKADPEVNPGVNKVLSNRYQLIREIGKGGMGEVFLAYDLACGRQIAVKQIRSDLLNHPQIRHRFLKEAHMTCQLTHPAIIPIFSIQENEPSAYYTMPFVEGETLKQIIRKSRQQEKKGEKPDYLSSSIPALMRIFLTICQAVAYSHTKNILHRDLKLENIIIGKYGEVFILDWGLAKFADNLPDETAPISLSDSLAKHSHLTRVGKVVGTIAYMAPERALGQPATFQTDIYSLGVILYQLLTLKNPFKRGTLEEFRQTMKSEEFIDPVISSPYRDVPHNLARVSEKCLSLDLQERYQSVRQIIIEIENYLGGRSEWFPIADLDRQTPNDWEFQENILIASHMAIAHMTEESDWFNLMISKQSFAGNIRIETKICFEENTQGIGFLISIPEKDERNYINDGYCLWLGSDQHRTTKLLRSTVEVVHAPDIFLKRHQWVTVRIEKIDRTIHLYLNDILQFSYVAHIPLIGTHIGLLSRDVDFSLEPLSVSLGSLNLTVNCLAIPDAFLAHRDFNQALSEYRRIAYSFPDRAEGREALFRAGLTFIEQAKGHFDKIFLLDQALQEFEKLHATPGAPLEYLGKGLVYQALKEEEEEVKCFEIAYRRYPNHPLLPILQEQILSRLHEVSRAQRNTTYRFALLTVRHFSPSAIDTHTKRLFASLQKHWETLFFIEECTNKQTYSLRLRFAIPIAFWLNQPYTIGEVVEQLVRAENPSILEINNALACLLELGYWKYVRKKLNFIKEENPTLDEDHWSEVEQQLSCHENFSEKKIVDLFSDLPQKLTFTQKRLTRYIIDFGLKKYNFTFVHHLIEILNKKDLSFEMQLTIHCQQITAYLLQKEWSKAETLFLHYPPELLKKSSTLLYFLYTCWLCATQNPLIAINHLDHLHKTSYPRSWTLGSHAINESLNKKWYRDAFYWEKKALYWQLHLYYFCNNQLFLANCYYFLSQKNHPSFEV